MRLINFSFASPGVVIILIYRLFLFSLCCHLTAKIRSKTEKINKSSSVSTTIIYLTFFNIKGSSMFINWDKVLLFFEKKMWYIDMTFSHSIVIIKDCFLKLLIDQPILFTIPGSSMQGGGLSNPWLTNQIELVS